MDQKIELNQSEVPPSETVESRRSYGRNRTYFFDVRRSGYGRYFLTISESQSKEGVYLKNRILINGSDLRRFAEVLQECVTQVQMLEQSKKSTVRETPTTYTDVRA